MPVQPVPVGYHTVTPYLIVRNAARALDFYKRAFGATELCRMADPSGKIGHAEIRIGNSCIMLADEFPEMGARSPESIGGSPISLYVYVENVDTVAQQAIDAGATVDQPVKDQFYGDRSGCFLDPFGHKWTISTHIEDLSPEEIDKRARAAIQQQPV
jgi:PhnB protein